MEKTSCKNVLIFLVKIILFSIVYFIVGKFGLSLAFFNSSASPIWPASGLVVVVLLLFGYRMWPAFLIGAFFVNWTTTWNIATSIAIAVGNTLEGLFIVFLIDNMIKGKKVFDSPDTILKFIFITICGNIISATIGITSLAIGNFANWASYISLWFTWWIGNFIGVIIVVPLIISWYTPAKISSGNIIEKVLAVLSIIAVGILVFTPWSKLAIEKFPLTFLCIIPILWVSIRFGQRLTTLSILILAIISIYSTINGYGPFLRNSINDSLVLLQLYIGVMGITGLILSSISIKKFKGK